MLGCYLTEGAYDWLSLTVEFRFKVAQRGYRTGEKLLPVGTLEPGGLKMFGKFQNLSPNFKICMLSSPFLKKKRNFQLKCNTWRWRHRWNLMTNFSWHNTISDRFFEFWEGTLRNRNPSLQVACFHFFLILKEPLEENHCRYWFSS